MVGGKSELFRRLPPKTVGVLRSTDQAQVSEVFSNRCQTKITVGIQLQRHMGLSISRKMGLKTNAIRVRFRVIRQEPGDRRIASVRGNEEPGLHGFVFGGDLPGRTAPNLQHRFSESNLGS